MALETTKGPYNLTKFHELWSTDGYIPILRKCCLLLLRQPLQNEVTEKKLKQLLRHVGK